MTIKPIINQKSGNDEKKDNVQRDKRINTDRLNYEVRRSPTSRSSNKSHGRSNKREKASSVLQVQTKYQPHASSSSSTSSVIKIQQLPCTTNVTQQNQIHGASTSVVASSSTECSKSDNNIASNSCVSKKNDKDGVDFMKILEEQVSGYNSGDEHLESKENNVTSEEWKNRDEKFSKILSQERGLIIKEMEEDGACLFRAISYQIYGDQDMHDMIRQQTMDYIYQNREYFEQFLTEDIHSYVKRKRQNHLHGNHIEIQAMSEMYNRPVELYCYELTPINIYNPEQINNGYDPLRLSYHRYSHYNAILDPYKSSVGVGLGLAGYRPEEFDPSKQVNDAIQISEQFEIEQMMVEDKLKTTDWEATNEVVVEQIARQSYLQFCKENMNKTFKKSSTSTITSTEASCSSIMSSCDTSPNNEHQQGCSSHQCERQKSPSYVDYYTHTPGRRKKRNGEKRKQEDASKEESSSPKRSKRLTPSPGPQSSSSSVSGESDNEKPVSAFYQSLLESSYADDGRLGQLSEQEMMQKALIQSIQDIAKTRRNKNNTDDEYDSP